MEAFENLLNRRSIRKFKSQKVSQENLQLILKAAMYTPSARNTQSWQFIVFCDKKNLEALQEIHPHGKMLGQAASAILVCGDKTLEENHEYLNTNCSAATQNILLAAHAMGIGSVWLGVYPRPERMKAMAEYAKLPETLIPISLIALGYPDEEKEMPQRFFPEKIKYDVR